MTTTAPSPLPRRGGSLLRPRRGKALLLAAAAPLLLALEPEGPRPGVMLMTGLPLLWGEKGPFDPHSRPVTAYSILRTEFDFRPVDVLDRPTLERGRVLFLAQPQRLSPAELAALDAWIRQGGRALILADPMLAWPSELPLGDIRRPPPVSLLGPLLGHWRVALEAPDEPGEVRARWNGRRIVLDSPGRFRSSSPDCAVAPEGWTADCRLGRGQVRLVADADLMHDRLWTSDRPDRPTAENPAVLGEWLDELSGTRHDRPRLREGRPVWVIAVPGLAVLLVGLAGIRRLLRRRRTR